jgi:hypothetical protein
MPDTGKDICGHLVAALGGPCPIRALAAHPEGFIAAQMEHDILLFESFCFTTFGISCTLHPSPK